MDPYRVFVGAVAGIAALLLLASQLIGGDSAGTALGGQDQVDEIRLEPISFVPPDPFTQPLAVSPTPTVAPTGTPTPSVAAPGEVDVTLPDDRLLPVDPPSEGSVRSAPGGTPGLYGGSLRYATCARQRLVDFLVSSPAKARAWVGALNSDPTLFWSGGSRLRVSDIPAYVFELTPVILRADTWVTNHGYSNGRATPIQSVLQAGTAVLVDAYGVPRVKCYCGNPLLPPRRFPPVYRGPRWPGFDPGKVVIITRPRVIIDIFILTDLDTGDTFERPPGTDGGGDVGPEPPTPTGPTFSVPPDVVLGTGDVQVTLLWQGGADLDLHVVDPQGVTVNFTAPTSPSGGQLDHDDTAGCDTGAQPHAENVFWPEGGAPTGQYQAFAVSFSGCGTPEPFQIRVTVNGAVVDTVSGSLADGATSEVVTFSA